MLHHQFPTTIHHVFSLKILYIHINSGIFLLNQSVTSKRDKSDFTHRAENTWTPEIYVTVLHYLIMRLIKEQTVGLFHVKL